VGKTFLAAFDALQAGAKSLLFLSHRKEHLTQAMRTFRHVFGQGRTYGRLYEGFGEAAEDFIFATVISAGGNPAASERHFDYVVVDEFHHAEAPSYKRLLAVLDYQFLLGLTATPERQDGHDVLALCDFNVAYEVRLVEAINRGWLLPFHYFGISDDTVDYGSIPWRSGRFDSDALEVALMLEKRVAEIVKHSLELGFDGPRRATVGFCAGVRHARFMADAFMRRGLAAVAVTGEDSVGFREAVYARLQDARDELEWVFVADVLNEGVDIPCINSILFLRPTESATIFIQQLGRGLRLSPGCEVLTVLDFVGHHKSAWLALSVLHDSDASVTAASIAELELTRGLWKS
jgi:superfamily II DNA or RNA helicase